MVKILALVILAWTAAILPAASAQTSPPTDQSYVVQQGDSLYAIVKLHFPEHRGSWLEVAEQLVALNPEAFPRGLDTPLRPGTQLRLAAAPADGAGVAVESINPAQSGYPSPVAGSADGSRQDGSGPARTTPATSGVGTTASPSITLTRETQLSTGFAAQIGVIANSSGRVTAVDANETERVLLSGDELFAGDTVQTAARSGASLQMLDDTVYQLNPASKVTFESYVYSPSTGRGNAIVTLITGGFRTTGGSLGTHDSATVTYNTPVATVGVRGTDVGLHVCAANQCPQAGGGSLGAGLYTGVLDGVLTLTNNSGELLARAGEFYWIKNPVGKPQPVPGAATLLFSPDELQTLDGRVETTEPLSFWAWLFSFLFGN